MLPLELGEKFIIDTSERFMRCFVLFGTFDKPARADVLNTKNSTAFYGCIKCYQSGITIQNKNGRA